MENEKLFSPLNLHLRDKEDAKAGVYDDIHYWRDQLSHEEAVGYIDSIEAFLSRDRQRYDNGRGLMEYCRSDILTDKVWSLIPTVEQHGGKLWLAADLRLNEPLSDREMADLISWWGGQLSDGWGEGASQKEIKVDRGDLYLEPWTATAGFFIATQAEFARRFGFEYLIPSPTGAVEKEAPRPEPEAAPTPRKLDTEELDALKLSVRLEQNLSEYIESVMLLEKRDIIGKSKTIAAMQDVHEYLSEEHEFTTEEVAFLLKFQNPLEVVADRWFTLNGLIDVSRVVPDTLTAMLPKHYALVSDAPDAPEDTSKLPTAEHNEDSQKQELFDRLEQNYKRMMSALSIDITRPGLTQQEFVNKAGEIVALDDAHFYMTEHHEFDVSEIQCLMQFENPLEIVTDAWKKRTDDISDMSFALNDVFNKQDELRSGYALAPDTNAVAEDNGHMSNSAVNPSVLAQIRDATRASKEPRKDKPARDKSELEH